MGRVDGTSWDNDRPAGVVLCFQVSRNSVEPVLANRRRNLFSHDDSGPSGTDEAKEVGPQVPIVILGFAFTRNGERLARGAAGPEFAVVGPPSKSSCKPACPGWICPRLDRQPCAHGRPGASPCRLWRAVTWPRRSG